MKGHRVTRRDFIRIGGGAGVGLAFVGQIAGRWFEIPVHALIPGGTRDPTSVPKYQTQLLIPPVMPRAGSVRNQVGPNADYYDISMRQFPQQILPAGLPAITQEPMTA